MVQRAERVLKEYLKSNSNLWWIKLQNIHTTKTPADFLVLEKERRYLIECKEINLTKGYSSFSFDRLTQEDDLLKFIKLHDNNNSCIFFLFRERTLKKSFMFFIPIDEYISIKENRVKKSLNLSEFLEYFSDRQVFVKNGIVDLNIYFN